MVSFKRFVFAFVAGAVSALSFSSLASASSDVQVGEDSTGKPIMLDVSSIINTTYRVYHGYGSGLLETTLHASCGESRLFFIRNAIYSSSGLMLGEDNHQKEMFPQPNSTGANSMRIVCKSVHARGW